MCEVDVDSEFCVETYFASPCGSPVKVLSSLDLLTINGRFTPHVLPPTDSESSTRSSSIGASPMPMDCIPEMEAARRLSLTPSFGRKLEALHLAQKQKGRRHSMLTNLTIGRSTPVFTYSPMPVNKNMIFKKDKDDRIKFSQIDSDNEDDTQEHIIVTHDDMETPDICNVEDLPKDETIKGNSSEQLDEEAAQKDDLYPNCDTNVWLRSCEQEIIEPIEGIVTGTIPEWLNGCLLRNGPGSLKVGDMMFNHLFDSSALLHRFGIVNGKVTYQCRFLQSDVYKKNTAANRIVVTEFGTSAVPDPCQSIFKRVSSMFKPGEGTSDNAMISIYPFGDEYFAFTESPVIHRVNAETLSTEGKLNMSDFIGIVNHSSHPHIMSDGTVYNLGTSVTKTGPAYNIICFPHGENMFTDAHIVGTVPARWKLHPGYMHTFGITENYFVIVEQPMAVSVTALVKSQFMNLPMSTALKWFEDKETHFYLISRDTGELVHTYKTESFFYLHIINQYEKEDHLVIDICCYKDPAMLNCMYIEAMKGMQQNPDYAKMFRGRPLRFVLPLLYSSKTKISPVRTPMSPKTISSIFLSFENAEKGGNDKDSNRSVTTENLVTLRNTKAEAYRMPDKSIFCKPELLCDLGCETPRVYYEEHLGLDYQFFYAISSDVDAENPGTLIKVDVVNKTRQTWCEDNCYPSEPIFVPSPDPKSEDDGVVLSALVWGRDIENRVGLLALCAKTWTELGRCEFDTPGPVPKCLHGWFAPVSTPATEKADDE